MLRRQFRCPDCRTTDAYRSRPRSFFEKYLLPLILLQPVRCAHCYRRSRVSVLVAVGERPTRTVRPAAA